MDGHCALCSRGARTIARWDRRREFRICTTESPLGQAVLRHYGLNLADPDSWLYFEDGRAYTSLKAVVRVGRRLGGIAVEDGTFRFDVRLPTPFGGGLIVRYRRWLRPDAQPPSALHGR